VGDGYMVGVFGGCCAETPFQHQVTFDNEPYLIDR
jgi:hypothetical protein